MPVLPIYTYNHSVLRKKAKPVKRVDETLVKTVEDMFDTMRTANGVGLAANQVGLLQRVIVVDITAAESSSEPATDVQAQKPIAMLNPEVVSEEGAWTIEEGCLSIPDIREEVERAESIRVRFKDLELKDQEIEAHGMLCRVILHEVDHLNGVLFIDRLGSVKRKLLRGRLNKIARGEIEVSYPTVTPVAAISDVA